MIGAIIGDYVGSTYEFAPTKNYDFEMMPAGSAITDDTIMSVAVADAVMHNKPFAGSLRYWGRKYPHPKGGYGGRFAAWLRDDTMPAYDSFGNGAAMRVSAIGWLYDAKRDVCKQAELATAVSHNHEEGIKGGIAIAYVIWMLRTGHSRTFVKSEIEGGYGYDLSTPLDVIRPSYRFDETCMGTVPQAIRCYLESSSFEDAIRLAVSLGGDADTIACITGSIAEAGYGTHNIPVELRNAVYKAMPADVRSIVDEFYMRVGAKGNR